MLFRTVVALLILVRAGSSYQSSHDCSDCLHYGSPESVGLLSKPLLELKENMTGYTHPANYGSPTHNQVHPIQPGAAVIVGHASTIVSEFAVGKALLYSDANGTLLPKDKQVTARRDTTYDLASLTKLYTTIAVLVQLDAGTIKLNATVASYIPAFGANDKTNVTILQMLTHTSGLPPDPSPPLFSPVYTFLSQRRAAILAHPLSKPPGSAFIYSDLNFMTLQLVLEQVTNSPLDKLVRNFTSALGVHDTFFNRGNIEGPSFPPYNRIAATEFQIAVKGPSVPQRPQPVRGTVHDENAWALDGVSGHAGLFSTVKDTAVLCQMILNNGTYGGKRILSTESVDLIFHNFNERFGTDAAHGLGFELDQYYWAGPMKGKDVAGHTGFTGTTLVIDRSNGTFFLLFANRVHPSRLWSSNNIARGALGYWVAKALGRDVVFPT